jgi:hypothetical protein
MLLSVSLLVFGTAAYGQEIPLYPGQTIRITGSECGLENHTGSYVDSMGDTLVVAFGTSTLRCAQNYVTKLEQRCQAESKLLQGFLVGLLAGGAAGAALGAVTYEECVAEPGGGWDCFMAPNSAAEQAAFGAIGGGFFGALIGALAGATNKAVRWEEVPLDRLQVSIAAQSRGRFALAVSLRF